MGRFRRRRNNRQNALIRIPSWESRIRKFNLLIEGTGIRYNIRPKRNFFGDSRRLAFFAAFGVSALVISYIAMQNKDALTRWELFPQEKLDIWVEIPVAENPAQTDAKTTTEESRRKRVVLDESGMLVSSANILLPLAAPAPADTDGSKSASEERYLIRFAVCLFKYSAESVKKELGVKGVDSTIQLGKRKMPFYRLKIGPFPDSMARKKVRGILKEMSIPVSPASSAEGKNITTAVIWLKNRVTKVKKRLDAMSVGVEVLAGKKEKTVFRVISSYFDDRSIATRRLKEWRKKRIDGVVEKVNS